MSYKKIVFAFVMTFMGAVSAVPENTNLSPEQYIKVENTQALKVSVKIPEKMLLPSKYFFLMAVSKLGVDDYNQGLAYSPCKIRGDVLKELYEITVNDVGIWHVGRSASGRVICADIHSLECYGDEVTILQFVRLRYIG